MKKNKNPAVLIKSLKITFNNKFSAFSCASLVIGLIILLMGCQNRSPLAVSLPESPQGISLASDSIDLEWVQRPVNADSGYWPIRIYNIFVRVHSVDTLKFIKPWKLLDSIPASRGTSVMLYRSQLGDSSIDFAVTAVDTGGSSSNLQTSLDTSSIPHSGWYLVGKL